MRKTKILLLIICMLFMGTLLFAVDLNGNWGGEFKLGNSPRNNPITMTFNNNGIVSMTYPLYRDGKISGHKRIDGRWFMRQDMLTIDFGNMVYKARISQHRPMGVDGIIEYKNQNLTGRWWIKRK